MKRDYLVSIIIPVYNMEKYLFDCLESVINQSYTKLDIIIVDDGSTDKSAGICDEYAVKDNRINVIHTVNGGVAAARNCGLRAVKGDYIAFVDPDDIISPFFIEELLKACTENGCSVAQCTHTRFKNKKEINISNETLPNYKVWSGREMCKKLYTSEGVDASVLWTKLYHKSVWEGISFPEGKIHEDFLVIYKVLYATEKIVCLNLALYYYRKNRSSITGRKFYNERFHYFDALRAQMDDYINWNEDELYTMAMEHYMYAIPGYCYKIVKEAGNNRKELVSVLQEKMKNAIEECDRKNIRVEGKYRLFVKHPVIVSLWGRAMKRLRKLWR